MFIHSPTLCFFGQMEKTPSKSLMPKKAKQLIKDVSNKQPLKLMITLKNILALKLDAEKKDIFKKSQFSALANVNNKTESSSTLLGALSLSCLSWDKKSVAVVLLMGRAASHITLECALQTHPNITLIGEEVACKKQTLKNVTDYIGDVVCKRGELGYNYGVILVPEGLVDFILEVQHLIAELNEILANDIVDEDGLWKKKLAPQSLELFALLPPANQGKFKPVIRKAMVELDAAPFKKFASLHEEWAQTNCYISPGPNQFVGPASDKVNHTLLLELGVKV